MSENCYFNADGGKIVLGRQVLFNRDVHINAACGGRIEIGDLSIVGPGVFMRTASHGYSDPEIPIVEQGHVVGDIKIGRDCWIGARVVVLGGVSIGDGAIVGAGAVVTRDIPSRAVAVGVPAKVINTRKHD